MSVSSAPEIVALVQISGFQIVSPLINRVLDDKPIVGDKRSILEGIGPSEKDTARRYVARTVPIIGLAFSSLISDFHPVCRTAVAERLTR